MERGVDRAGDGLRGRPRWAYAALLGLLAGCAPTQRSKGADVDQQRLATSAATYRKCILDTPESDMRSSAEPREIVAASQSRCRNEFRIMMIAADTWYALQESSDEALWAHGQAVRFVEARETEAATELKRRVSALHEATTTP